MTILLFSALLLLLILLIKYFAHTKRNIGLKILLGFGIIIGILALGLNSLFDNSFGASTPTNVQVENLTDKNLKIYVITFWDNSWSGKGNFVNYDTELKAGKSSTFWFENDGTTEFWVVAKNENNEIEYLKVISETESQVEFKIAKNRKIDLDKSRLAKELTLKTDKEIQMEKYFIWANIILIGLLILSLIKRKTGGNTV
jgi:hypothetical protein